MQESWTGAAGGLARWPVLAWLVAAAGVAGCDAKVPAPPLPDAPPAVPDPSIGPAIAASSPLPR